MESQELTGNTADSYTEAYVESLDSGHIYAAGQDFATALAMIERLSPGDDEKAEAARQLMAQGESK